VKRICDGYNWGIDVKSHFGKGTTFVVTMKKNEYEKKNIIS
jgi:signal transduction histidine kinase